MNIWIRSYIEEFWSQNRMLGGKHRKKTPQLWVMYDPFT